MAKEKAQVGDLIRIVKRSQERDPYSVGAILEVVERLEDNCVGAFHQTFGELEVLDYEYEIYRKAGEEDEVPSTGIVGVFAKVFKDHERAKNPDAVNPQHYKQFRVEVIDIIEDAVQGADPFEAALHANIVKYTLRYRNKNGVEDLRKSIWYTEKLIAYLESKTK